MVEERLLINLFVFLLLMLIIAYVAYCATHSPKPNPDPDPGPHPTPDDNNIYNFPFENYHTFSEIIQIGNNNIPYMLNILENYRPWVVHLPQTKKIRVNLYDSYGIKNWGMYATPYYSCITKHTSGILFNVAPRIGAIALSFFAHPQVQSDIADERKFTKSYDYTSTVNSETIIHCTLTVVPYIYCDLKSNSHSNCMVYLFHNRSVPTSPANTPPTDRHACFQTMIGLLNYVAWDIQQNAVDRFIISGYSDLYSSEWRYAVKHVFPDEAVHISPGVADGYITHYPPNEPYYTCHDMILVSTAFAKPVWGLIYPDWISPADSRHDIALRVGIVGDSSTDKSNIQVKQRKMLTDRFEPYTNFALKWLENRKATLGLPPEPATIPDSELADIDYAYSLPFTN